IGGYRAAERGERNRRPAVKQHPAELALQRADGVRQRGLRHAAAFGREGEALLLAQCQEITDLVHLHGSIWPRRFRLRRTMPSNGAAEGDPHHTSGAFIFGPHAATRDVSYFTLDRVRRGRGGTMTASAAELRIELAHVERGDRAAEALELELAHGF